LHFGFRRARQRRSVLPDDKRHCDAHDGAATGETCGTITATEGDYVVQTSVYSLPGDSGSPGFVKNPDGSATAVGILTSSDEGDDHTTYFIVVQPLLVKWGLQIL
jgi:hypothetical protein